DIYSLGATGYFLLTGKAPFEGAKVAQKLMAHQSKIVTPVHEVRPDVPVELSEAIARMLAKKPGDRFQTPAEAMEALEPWATTPSPPTELEIPGAGGGRPASAVELNLVLARRAGGSSISSGSSASSGSAIRYHGGSHRESGVRSGLPTPPPAVAI